MRVSIGILARNEESGIARMLRSTTSQTIFTESCAIQLDTIALIVVPNGCSDKTADVASETIAKYQPQRPGVALSVHPLERGDKANAWNVFVHELSPSDSDVLLLLDADIEFASDDTLEKLLTAFDRYEQVQAVSDTPIPRVDAGHGMIARLAARVGSMTGDAQNRHSICGQCYAARASTLRQILIPVGLPVEDGFVRACLVTGGFTFPDVPNRVQVESGTTHYFRPPDTLKDVFHHQVRLAVGTALNGVLFDILWREAPEAGSVAEVVRRYNQEDAKWVAAALDRYIHHSGRRLISRDLVFRRIERLKSLPWKKRLLKLPVACAATVFDLLVFCQAIRVLRGGKAVSYW